MARRVARAGDGGSQVLLLQCRLTAGIPTILLEQKVLGQPFSKDNSTSIVHVIHTTCTSELIYILSTVDSTYMYTYIYNTYIFEYIQGRVLTGVRKVVVGGSTLATERNRIK
eukprot:COSAG02_NODE_810_length_16920_cov_466.145286_6_plen_112_part_00